MAVSSLVTTDYVLDETITLVRFAHSHEKAVELGEASLSSRLMKTVYVTADTFREAWNLFKEDHDREWSFTDCVSFTVMRELGIGRAFTFDKHYRQAGFEVFP